MKKNIKAVRRKYSGARWVEVRNGVFDQWHVGRIVTANGTILYPPLTINTRGHGSVPVQTGVTVRPGDTPASVIRDAIRNFPAYLGQYSPGDLRLQIQDI